MTDDTIKVKVKANHSIIHDGTKIAPGTVFSAPLDLVLELEKLNAVTRVPADSAPVADAAAVAAAAAKKIADDAAAAKAQADEIALEEAEKKTADDALQAALAK